MEVDDRTLLSVDQDTLLNALAHAKECEACLIVVRGHQQGKRFELSAPEMTLGRDGACDIVIHDPRVSRHQAMLVKDTAGVQLVDGGSTNGTHVNNQHITNGDRLTLCKDDLIRIGSTILKYLPRGELEISYIDMLELRAHTDGLTHLYNKGYLLDAMEAEFKRAKALRTELSLLVFDLDFFKRVNDTLGHDAGDHVLVEVSKVLQTAISNCTGILGRFGGEEFVALLPAYSLTQAVAVAEAARVQLEHQELSYQGHPLRITASVGVAAITAAMTESKQLFQQADAATYRAKEDGRNRVCSSAAA